MNKDELKCRTFTIYLTALWHITACLEQTQHLFLVSTKAVHGKSRRYCWTIIYPFKKIERPFLKVSFSFLRAGEFLHEAYITYEQG